MHTHVVDLEQPGHHTDDLRRASPSRIAKPVRPIESSWWVALPFIASFVVLALMLGIIYGKARINGTFSECSREYFKSIAMIWPKVLTSQRPTITKFEYDRTEYPRKLHSYRSRYVDRTYVDTHQPNALHASTSGGTTELQRQSS